MTGLARSAEEVQDPWEAFETLLYGYLESAEPDAAFRFALLGPEEPNWEDILAETRAFAAIVERIVRRAVDAGLLRADFRANDFILVARGAMANMTGGDNWRRYLAIVLDGIRGSAR
jgi:transcriptional regulator SbtR-like protein